MSFATERADRHIGNKVVNDLMNLTCFKCDRLITAVYGANWSD